MVAGSVWSWCEVWLLQSAVYKKSPVWLQISAECNLCCLVCCYLLVMDSIELLSVVGGLLLLSIIFATSLCTYCWGHKQPTSIPQRPSDYSSEYNSQSSAFGLRHPHSTYAPHPDHRITGIPYPIHNSLSSPSITITKVPSCPPSETESQASYVNQSGPSSLENENELNIHPPSDYIVVLPDSPTAQLQERSRASSQSSGGENYINIISKDGNVSVDTFGCDVNSDIESEGQDYENFPKSSEHCGLSRESLSSDGGGSAEYVNTGKVCLGGTQSEEWFPLPTVFAVHRATKSVRVLKIRLTARVSTLGYLKWKQKHRHFTGNSRFHFLDPYDKFTDDTWECFIVVVVFLRFAVFTSNNMSTREMFDSAM